MPTLAWIAAATFVGGSLSIVCAAALALPMRASLVPLLISYAIGALLGASFLEILPEAFEHAGGHLEGMAATVLLGILLFFLLEKLVLWRHCHGSDCEAHGHEGLHDHGRTGMMVMLGDLFHNFVDGILIAAAFLTSTQLGIVTALAIIAHEIPQEVGDFVVLLHSGFSKKATFLFNILTSFATLAGGVIAYFALQTAQGAIPACLALAAASMIYIAVADLIPGLHRRAQLRDTLQQIVLIGLGVGSIWLTQVVLGHH